MPQKVAFVGGFLPRQGHSSRLVTELFNNFVAEYGNCECIELAVSDVWRKYPYPSRVHFEIAQAIAETYRSAADYLNLNGVDLVCLQYAPQIYGGAGGSYVLQLARAVYAPLVTLLCEVNPQPDAAQKEVIRSLDGLSAGWVCLGRSVADTLAEIYEISPGKVDTLSLPERDVDETAWRALVQQMMAGLQRAHQNAAQGRIAARKPGPGFPIPATGGAPGGEVDQETLPVLKLDHYLRLTDETGMLKSSILSLPDYSQGYATADNARALIFSLLLEQAGEGPFIPIEMQAARHLAFLWGAYNQQVGRFRDSMSYTRAWLDDRGSEETHGLAVWALGMVLGRPGHASMQGAARRLFESALPACKRFSSLRAWGYSLLGVDEYLRRFPGDRQVSRTGDLLLDRLIRQYRTYASPEWPWFEGALQANSASLAQAMIAAANWSADQQAAEIGLVTLDWLLQLQFLEDGRFVPLGDRGYYRRGGPRARFAQRPTEARAMLSACLEAYRYTGDVRWLQYAQAAFQWFLGRNDLGQPLYDPETGGCCDGILPGRLDRNYSAAALLAYLVAHLEMHLMVQLYRQRSAAPPQFPILNLPHP